MENDRRQRRQAGDPVTRRVEDHLDLVGLEVHEISTSLPPHVDRSELEAAARLGLFDAARRFDEALGVPFRAYAKRRIRGAVLDALRDLDWAPRRVRHDARLLATATEALTGRLGRAPTEQELADESGLGVEAVRRTRDAAATATLARLDDTARRGDAGPAEALAELLLCPATGAEQRIEDIEMRLMVSGALAALDDRARRIICAIYLEGRVQQDIADELGITESRVSQIHHATLHVLGDMLAVYLPERAAKRPEPKAAAGRERRSRSATQAIARYRAWYEQQRGGLVAA